MRQTTWKVIACVFLLGAAIANADPILEVEDGILVGASNIDVAGTLYDVKFVGGSCVEVFSGCDEASDFDFQDDGPAANALQALIDTVWLDGPLGLFDSMPQLTAGCPSIFLCGVVIPIAVFTDFDRYDALIGENVRPDPDFENGDEDSTNAFIDSIHTDLGDSDVRTFGRWTLSTFEAKSVPEPSSLILFLAGLIAMGFSTFRRQPIPLNYQARVRSL